MDSGPTLDVVDYGLCEDEEDVDGEEVDGGEREVWGRLFPLGDAYSKTGTWVYVDVMIICGRLKTYIFTCSSE